jgi:hypothetical protein
LGLALKEMLREMSDFEWDFSGFKNVVGNVFGVRGLKWIFFVSFIFVFWVNLQVLLVKYAWIVGELYIEYKRVSDSNVWFVLCEKCKIGGGVKVLWEVRWEFKWGLCGNYMRVIWHCFKVFLWCVDVVHMPNSTPQKFPKNVKYPHLFTNE